MKNISRLVRAQRKKLGLTIEQLAEKAGVSVSLLSRVERGDVDNISIKKLSEIAAALGLNLADFFVGEQMSDVDSLALISYLKAMPAAKRQALATALLDLLHSVE
ncbi:helix-turn-helix domain-containing protein [Lacticaseibacillus jixianensis]|uniref:Helix-turn-helix domain-containing protein n=1 Tax=Lacticaseibacillus jixianensis TaxID=2486012 RepID=A0ABW4B6S1_9LACO|nr:helix-turn-helix transcriptional regulator [Lacticaseibacillus jixianensis]